MAEIFASTCDEPGKSSIRFASYKINDFQYLIILNSRGSVEKSEKHEKFIILTETRGDDAKGVHERNHDENVFPTDRVCHRTPKISSDHHT